MFQILFAILSFILPIVESGEPLVDVKDEGIIAYREDLASQYPHCTKVRRTVYEKLCEAQTLLPEGVRFRLTIGFRSLKRQQELFESIYQKIADRSPGFSEEELFRATSQFVTPLRTWEGEAIIPPHCTGGAIDIVLIDWQGERVDMANDIEEKYEAEIIRTDSTLISAEARKNRDIMGEVLSAVGFINYPAEFWHWSYGDRFWAEKTGAEQAIYGPIDF